MAATLSPIPQAPPDPKVVMYQHTHPKDNLEANFASFMAKVKLCAETTRPPTKKIQCVEEVFPDAPARIYCSVFVVAVD